MWFSFIKAVVRGEHRVAPLSWFALAGTVLYTLWPVDLVPELLLPVVGYVDDLGLWGVFLVLATRERARWQAGWRARSVAPDPASLR